MVTQLVRAPIRADRNGGHDDVAALRSTKRNTISPFAGRNQL
jgi:hypothetical protein